MTLPNIAFIGGGNMARALIAGLLKHWQPQQITVAEPNAELRAAFAQDFAINVTAHNSEAAKAASIWILAVKPQVMKTVCSELATCAEQCAPMIISIAAGIQLANLRDALGQKARLIRTMPNTPALIGEGITALFAEPAVLQTDRQLAEQIMRAAGPCVWLEQESLMDAVTATSGSGPAYFFLLMECMQKAAIAQGLPTDVAKSLVLQTALGAARMALQSNEEASVLRQRVTSPNGTTQAALDVLFAAEFPGTVDAAIQAATLRGRELSKQLAAN